LPTGLTTVPGNSITMAVAKKKKKQYTG